MPKMYENISDDDFTVVDEHEHAVLIASSDERNEAFRAAAANGMPVMWIDARRKYGDVEVDFITTPPRCRGLNKAARKQAQWLNDYFFGRTLRRCKESHRSDVVRAGPSSIIEMKGLLLDDAVDYSKKLGDIVYDEENWKTASSKR